MARLEQGVLWMGGLGTAMTAQFLQEAFVSLGEGDMIKVEIVKNKFTGKSAGYGLVHFETDAAALMAMHKLNEKLVPNSQPPIRFQLNHSSAQAGGNNLFKSREFSIWVTDLPADCTDHLLLKTFSTRFDSIVKAKVQVDSSHGGKPYGFVRFTSQQEQRDALIHMDGFRGLGEKAIKVSMAIPKTKMEEQILGKRGVDVGGEYGGYYEQYWADNAAWGNYGRRGGKAVEAKGEAKAKEREWEDWLDTDSEEEEDRAIPWDRPVNVEAMNKRLMERSQDAWASGERDRWLYSFDTEDSILPDFERPVAGGARRKVDEEQLFLDLGGSAEGRGPGEAVDRPEEDEDWETRPMPATIEERGEAWARAQQEGDRDFAKEDEEEFSAFMEDMVD